MWIVGNVFFFLSFSHHHLNSSGGTTFMSEPYYREYFAGDAQGYAPARAIYGDADGPQGATTYEGRFSNHHSKNTPVYAKTVTAAGLTVDLPSPDSGIGTDAITPRDQNNIQQVIVIHKELFFFRFIICVEAWLG